MQTREKDLKLLLFQFYQSNHVISCQYILSKRQQYFEIRKMLAGNPMTSRTPVGHSNH